MKTKAVGMQLTLRDGTQADFFPLVIVFEDNINEHHEKLECYSDHFIWNGIPCTDEVAIDYIKRIAKYYEDIAREQGLLK